MLSRIGKPLANTLLLFCSLLAGLLPPLIWLLAAALWYYLPHRLSLDITPLTWAALLLAPFIAGFCHARWCRRSGVLVGALPALLLWLPALACRLLLFGGVEPRAAAQSLAIALLLGAAGALSAEKVGRRAAASAANGASDSDAADDSTDESTDNESTDNEA